MAITCKFITIPVRGIVNKVYYNSDNKEYIARFYVDGVLQSAYDYFTNELEDACDTAIAEVGRMIAYYGKF